MLPTSGCSQSSALYTRAVLGLHGVKIFGSVARAETCCEAQRESPAEADFGLGVLSQETIPPTADAHSCLLISSSASKVSRGLILEEESYWKVIVTTLLFLLCNKYNTASAQLCPPARISPVF